MNVTILGCGPSSGVPLSNGEWGACDPKNPKNYRTRTSAAITFDNGKVWLIDTSPDLRQQLLRENITHVEGVLITHAHADHINGLDDLRPLYFATQRPIPLYADASTLDALRVRFPYLVRQGLETSVTYPVFVDFCEIIPHQPMDVEGVRVIAFEQDHGGSVSLGFRFPNVAYSTDVLNLSATALALLHGVEVWIVDCMDIHPRPTHAHLEKVLGWINRVRPKRTVLTHLSHLLDVEAFQARLPEGVEVAYDGLSFEV